MAQNDFKKTCPTKLYVLIESNKNVTNASYKFIITNICNFWWDRHLDEVGEEDDDLLVLIFGQDLEIRISLAKEVNLVQDPLGAVGALPKISGHSGSVSFGPAGEKIAPRLF
jgi:hypothetical protein